MFNPKEVFIIAEAGVNHDGEIEKAMRLVDIASESGVDAVKFQTFKPGECTGRFAFMTDYQKDGACPDEDRYMMSARLALTYDHFREIAEYAKAQGVLFLSTPDGFESLDFLVDELEIPLIKVGSTEVTNLPYLEAIGRKNLPTILSTGLSTLGEVETALVMLRKGCDSEIVLLHCTSEYPAPISEVNLLAMNTLAKAFQVKVGFSDHTVGMEASVAAVALGASVIEKHYTLDKSLPGPDHKASLSPEELKDFVGSVRKTKLLLGGGIKQPTASELKNMESIRRSIVASGELAEGTVLEKKHLAFKRPGTGIPPGLLEAVIGMRLNRGLVEDEVLTWDDLK